MGDQKYILNKHRNRLKRDNAIYTAASIIGTLGLIYALAVTQTLFMNL